VPCNIELNPTVTIIRASERDLQKRPGFRFRVCSVSKKGTSVL
jgi:hypothetical protein